MRNKKYFNVISECYIDKNTWRSYNYNIYHRPLRIWKNTYLIFNLKELSNEQWNYLKCMLKPYKGKIWNYDLYNNVLKEITQYLNQFTFSPPNSYTFALIKKIKRKKIVKFRCKTFLI